MRIFSYKIWRKTSFAIVLFISLFIASFGIQIKSVSAIGLPLGGTSGQPVTCTCGYTSWMAVSHMSVTNSMPKGYDGEYSWSSNKLITSTYPPGMPRAGVKLMATYLPAIPACWMQAGYTCSLYSTRGLITIIGTSKTPQ